MQIVSLIIVFNCLAYIFGSIKMKWC